MHLSVGAFPIPSRVPWSCLGTCSGTCSTRFFFAGLVKAVNTAVDLIVAHFGTSRDPGVKVGRKVCSGAALLPGEPHFPGCLSTVGRQEWVPGVGDSQSEASQDFLTSLMPPAGKAGKQFCEPQHRPSCSQVLVPCSPGRAGGWAQGLCTRCHHWTTQEHAMECGGSIHPAG